MRTVTLYPLQNRIIYAVNDPAGKKHGELEEDDLERFLSDNPPGILNVILPKPEVIFRKLDFPFSGRRSVNLVIPQELENVLPEAPENYHYYFEFNPAGKNRTAVNVYAVKNAVCGSWKSLAKKYTSKVFFFSDTIILYLLLKQYAAEKNHIGIYCIRDYLLVNLTENGVLSGSYSYDFKASDAERTKELLAEFLARKELKVFMLAGDDTWKELGVPAERMQEIRPLPDTEQQFLLHSLLAVAPYRKPLKLQRLHHSGKFPVYETTLIGIFLAVSALSLSPYVRAHGKQKRVTELDGKMRETFLATCPEVTKVVNPLVQMKEKIAERKSVGNVISGYPSVLKIMADITALFPENTTASVDQFTIAGDTLTISGNTDSLKSLEAIKEKIEASKSFTITDMGTISYDARNRVNFNITLGMVNNG